MEALGQFKRFFSVIHAKTFRTRKNFPGSNATLLPMVFRLCLSQELEFITKSMLSSKVKVEMESSVCILFVGCSNDLIFVHHIRAPILWYSLFDHLNTESYSKTFYWSISREGVMKEGNGLKDGSIFLENSTCCQPFVINQSV